MKAKKLELNKEAVISLTRVLLDDVRGGVADFQSTHCTIYCSETCPPPTTSPACRGTLR
jgi:hypothetical protein